MIKISHLPKLWTFWKKNDVSDRISTKSLMSIPLELLQGMGTWRFFFLSQQHAFAIFTCNLKNISFTWLLKTAMLWKV